MRVFYIFNVKDEIYDIYNDKSNSLYKIYSHIYNLSDNELNYAKTLLDQLNNTFDKDVLDTKLFIKLHKEVPYSKRGEIHYINNLYKDEISKLIIRKRYIKIITESNTSSFFSILQKFNLNLFICDFSNSFYFFLDELKTLV